LVDVSFVDDVSIPVTAPADQIVCKSGRVVCCVCDVFRRYGMTLNFKPGKSEGIIGFFGPSSRIARAKLAADSMQITISDGFSTVFRFVSVYQHVGTCIAVNLNMCEEISKRCGMMRTESRNLSHKILKAEGITLDQKILVMQSYILSKGTFQCGAWPALPDVQYKRFHKCILDIYRSVCGHVNFKSGGDETIDVGAMFSDDDVIYKYGFMNPMTMLRMAKLGLFSRIIAKQPPLLIQLIVAQSSYSKGWCHSLLADLAWLWPSLDINSCAPSCMQEWIDIVSKGPTGFYNKAKKYCKSPFANVCSQWAISPVLKVFAQPVACVLCNSISKSKQAHSLHMFKKHGVKSDFRRYVPLTHCTVCLREFGQRETCLNHIRYRSNVCRNNLLLRGPLLSEAEALALDEACKARNRELHAAGRRRHHVDAPSFYLSGPLLPILLAPGQFSAHHPLGKGHRYT